MCLTCAVLTGCIFGSNKVREDKIIFENASMRLLAQVRDIELGWGSPSGGVYRHVSIACKSEFTKKEVSTRYSPAGWRMIGHYRVDDDKRLAQLLPDLKDEVIVLGDDVLVSLMNFNQAAIWFKGCSVAQYVYLANLGEEAITKMSGTDDLMKRPQLQGLSFGNIKLDAQGDVSMTARLIALLNPEGPEEDFGTPVNLLVSRDGFKVVSYGDSGDGQRVIQIPRAELAPE